MQMLRAILFCLMAWGGSLGFSQQPSSIERPNILWITSEDNGPQLGCYGDDYADTPNLDRLASRSLRYRRCWSNAPVCAPARTTLIAGMYATSLGAHHMRSAVRVPDDVRMYPEVLREAGYYCTNNSKKDYNFLDEDGGWNESSNKAHWRNRPDAKTPFFAVFNFTVSHESKIRSRPHQLKHDPALAPLPAYHPDTPEVRHDWAQYYDKVTEMDAQVGNVLRQLDEDGLRDSTIVFYYGDHGSGMPRSKRWPFDSGLRVPLIVHFPEQFRSLAPSDYRSGGESQRLVSFVDLGPTAISLAGVEPPATMQGIPFAGKFAGKAKSYLFGYRGRMDERIDMVRSCTDGRFVYMRHFYPDRPYLKHVEYMFQTPTTRVWKALFDQGKLNAEQAKFWQPKPFEELFDLEQDPDEVHNLADSPEYASRLSTMRTELNKWMTTTLDCGLMPEAEMHRLVGDGAPRQYALDHASQWPRYTDVAWSATDTAGGLAASDLIRLAEDDDSVIRFWAARGLALRNEGGTNDLALQPLATDPSPSVAIAANDGLLKSPHKATRRAAMDRLIDLANVENVGHYAAVAALNVIDMNGEIDAQIRERLQRLPRSVKKPPTRMGKYVGKLITHALAQQDD